VHSTQFTIPFNYGSLCDTKRDAILTCDRKPTSVRFIYSRETTTKTKTKTTVRGICGVSPEEEKVGYGGNDLQKMKVLSLE